MAELVGESTEALAGLDEPRLDVLTERAAALASELSSGAYPAAEKNPLLREGPPSSEAELGARMRVFAAVLGATGEHLAWRVRRSAARRVPWEETPWVR